MTRMLFCQHQSTIDAPASKYVAEYALVDEDTRVTDRLIDHLATTCTVFVFFSRVSPVYVIPFKPPVIVACVMHSCTWVTTYELLWCQI